MDQYVSLESVAEPRVDMQAWALEHDSHNEAGCDGGEFKCQFDEGKREVGRDMKTGAVWKCRCCSLML